SRLSRRRSADPSRSCPGDRTDTLRWRFVASSILSPENPVYENQVSCGTERLHCNWDYRFGGRLSSKLTIKSARAESTQVLVGTYCASFDDRRGAGHNNLVCSAYLAKAGYKV